MLGLFVVYLDWIQLVACYGLVYMCVCVCVCVFLEKIFIFDIFQKEIKIYIFYPFIIVRTSIIFHPKHITIILCPYYSAIQIQFKLINHWGLRISPTAFLLIQQQHCPKIKCPQLSISILAIVRSFTRYAWSTWKGPWIVLDII